LTEYSETSVLFPACYETSAAEKDEVSDWRKR